MKIFFTGGGGTSHSFSTTYNHNKNIFFTFFIKLFPAQKIAIFLLRQRVRRPTTAACATHYLLLNRAKQAQKKKNMETKALTSTKVAAINAIAARMKVNEWNDDTIKMVFAEFQDLRKEWESDERKEASKVFFANFDKLTTAKIKVVTRINENKTTKNSEKAKVIANVIFADIDTQRRKVRGMLSNAVERKAQVYKLAYTKGLYLATFDTLTEEEFLGLYKGVATIKVEDVIALLTAKLK